MAVPEFIKETTLKIRHAVFGPEITEEVAHGIEEIAGVSEESRADGKSALMSARKIEDKYKEQLIAQDLNPNKDPELVDLREGFDTAGERIKKFETDTTAQLAHNENDITRRGINVLNVNVKADGTDQSAPFQNALNIAAVKKTPMIIPYEEEAYVLDGEIEVPEGVNLIGQGSKVIIHGSLSAKGSNIIQGIVFDGEWNIQGNFVQVLGNGVKILFNTFKNLKANGLKETNGINFQGFGDAFVFGNIFDGVEANSTTAADGKSEIISRAIRIQNGENIKVQNNIFRGMRGYKDSDYIFVRSDQVSLAQYPYRGVFDGHFKELKGIDISHNIFYQIYNKSSVKLQASGVSVKHNEFIHGYNTDASGRPLAVLRAHNTNNTEFEDNTIRVQGNEILYLILGEYSKTLSVKRNKIVFDRPLTKDINAFMRPLFFMSVENLLMKDNYVEGYNIREFIRLDGCKNPKIKNNEFDYRTVDQQGTLISTTNSQSGINNTGVEFTENTITGLLATSLSIALSNIADLTFKNNNFSQVGVTAAGMVLTNVTGAFIGMNNIPKSGQYAVSLYAGCENITLAKNRYGSGLTTLFRIYNPAIAVKADDNYTDAEPATVYNVGSSGQNMAELEYRKGNKPITGYDYGRSGSKPSINKPINYKFFDIDLNKELSWTGSAWV